MITLRCAALVAVVGAAACATPGQVRRVETQVLIGQTEQKRADSARASELSRLFAQQARLMDSMVSLTRALDEKLGTVDRNTQGAIDDIRRDISVLAQATNVSAQKLAQIRSDMESRAAASGGDSTGGNASDDAINRAANQELLAGRYQTAREAYHDLLTRYPNSTYAPTALVGIGRSFETTQPDSAKVYYQMVLKLPVSPASQTAMPTALWKLGQLEERRGNSDAAKAYYQQIVDKFRNSPEYDSALPKVRKP